MNNYSKASRQRLDECHPDLQIIFEHVLPFFDHTIIKGHRGEQEQNEAFRKGHSMVAFPNSKHNKKPSMAVDVLPFPVNWQDTNRMRLFAGHVIMAAHLLYEQGKISHKIRWGGDWNRNTIMTDQNFHDLPHYELIEI